ncbi:cache domain-containing protein, partial [Klebsiella pneumoniae]|uniref:cache domain-containing protein n=1 Tax=Klebsiella pneumoniae TaxID=573 RepID=UPI001953D8A9
GQTMGDKIVDGKGRKTVKDMAAALKASPNGQAFVDTNFPRPGGKEAVPKLQFLMEVPGWGWMIGSGLYMDDINELVWRAATQEVAVG